MTNKIMNKPKVVETKQNSERNSYKTKVND